MCNQPIGITGLGGKPFTCQSQFVNVFQITIEILPASFHCGAQQFEILTLFFGRGANCALCLGFTFKELRKNILMQQDVKNGGEGMARHMAGEV